MPLHTVAWVHCSWTLRRHFCALFATSAFKNHCGNRTACCHKGSSRVHLPTNSFLQLPKTQAEVGELLVFSLSSIPGSQQTPSLLFFPPQSEAPWMKIYSILLLCRFKALMLFPPRVRGLAMSLLKVEQVVITENYGKMLKIFPDPLF